MLDTTSPTARRIETDIPFRLDRLTWSRFHTLVVIALGITWVLDGLEVTLAGSIAGALKKSPVLHFTAGDVGLASSFYLIGAVAGALFFGWLTDRLGRKKLFFITLAVYLTATAATAFSWNIWSFCFFRLLTGAGIGGEYSAINSTIQELVPARYRGHTDLAINGSFWVGAARALSASIVLLNPLISPSTSAGALHSSSARCWPHYPVHAHVDPGEPALARHPRPRTEAEGCLGHRRRFWRAAVASPSQSR